MDKIIYFDICAVPVYVIVICTTLYRKMTKGRSNKLYLAVTVFALVAVLAEILEKIAYIDMPIDSNEILWAKSCEYLYFASRNGINLLYTLFVISMTKTWYRIRPLWTKLLICLPYMGILGMLFTNETTSAVFKVLPDIGYTRGDYIIIVYILAFSYMIFGTVYLICNRRAMDTGEWMGLMSMYIINLAVVILQYFLSRYLVESFATSLTILFVVSYVLRPAKRVDINTGLQCYRAFCEEMGKIKVTGHNVMLVIVSIINAEEMSVYLKDSYNDFIHIIDAQIRICARKERVSYELYYEQPGNFYIILDDDKYNPVQIIPEIRERVRSAGAEILEKGTAPDTRMVTVNFQREIDSIDELLRFCHNFVRFTDYSKVFSRASSIISNRAYQIEAHIDEILNRAISSDCLKVRYQPLMSVTGGRASTVETVIELTDEIYGSIDTELLTSAAEESGAIVLIENRVMDDAFSFAGSGEFADLGFSRVHIRLSVTRCMQMNLTDTIWQFRDKYRVPPDRIAFEIRESPYENMSSVFNENLKKLSAQGYTIVLNGFGRGYSNMQHLLDMPIKAVKLDNNLVLSASSKGGLAILDGIIKMLRAIPLEVIAGGADNKETADMLFEMGCDMVQGHFYADPAERTELTGSTADGSPVTEGI